MVNEAPIYALKNVSLTFGVRPLFTSVNMNICRGDKICLVGRNGSGKSTLLKIISGLVEPDGGEIFSQPGINVAYMAQEDNFAGYETLNDVILSGLKPEERENGKYKADILSETFNIRAEISPGTEIPASTSVRIAPIAHESEMQNTASGSSLQDISRFAARTPALIEKPSSMIQSGFGVSS